eukprot:CAMPEP_0194317460 /NCGR_PEP_ID=MMETSP0171-20130528/14197_1 /TAXON_ID=218684 /ORGANISM="Corethron pennatum, Strain L29A3" /LENGTH=445 /DNA_ID=CAMNT_0039074051 /DNA_START=840 /DNA_END=2178 /DNA_ORIENTATION=-
MGCSITSSSASIEVKKDIPVKAENRTLFRNDSQFSPSSNGSDFKGEKRRLLSADSQTSGCSNSSHDKNNLKRLDFQRLSLEKKKLSSDSISETTGTVASSIKPLARFGSVLNDNQWEYIQSQWGNVQSELIEKSLGRKNSVLEKVFLAKQLSTIKESNDEMKPKKKATFFSKLKESPKLLTRVKIAAIRNNGGASSIDSPLIIKRKDISESPKKINKKDETKNLKKKEKKINKCSSPCHIAVVGPPTSGKRTQGGKIAKKTGAVHISASDLLRYAVDNKTANGLVIEEFVHEKKSVPDVIVSKLMIDRLQEHDCQTQGWILTGFPNTLGQVEALKTEGMQLEHFIMLHTPYEVLESRVKGRSYDPVTGRRYNATHFSSLNPKVKKRLRSKPSSGTEIFDGVKEFNKNAKLLKQCYFDILFEVDGTQKPANIYKDIYKHVLKSKQR